MFRRGEKSLSYKNIYIVLSLKITKSTVFGKFFRRDTAVSCSMCKKLCPLACNARTKHMVNKKEPGQAGEWWIEGGNRHGSTGEQASLKKDQEGEKREMHTPHHAVKRREGGKKLVFRHSGSVERKEKELLSVDTDSNTKPDTALQLSQFCYFAKNSISNRNLD